MSCGFFVLFNSNSKLITRSFKLLSFAALFLFLFFFPSYLFSQTLNSKPSTRSSVEEPFTFPSNWGGTGLMEVPTARIMRKNSYRLGFGEVRPYRYYYGTISPFSRLEITGRITEEMGIPSGLVSQKNFKDKAIDFKYRILSEGKYMPALAVGIMDPHGTRIFPSQYIVAGKQIYPFDFTLGFGNGRFGRRPVIASSEDVRIEMITHPRQWLEDAQFFWGVQFVPSEKYALMLEYSPVKYHKQTGDPAQRKNFQEPVPSEYNFGLRYKPAKWAEIDLSYQRGNRFGVSLSTSFDIGKPLIPIYDPVYREKSFDMLNPIQGRLAKALHNSGFSDIGVAVIDGQLWIEAQNDKYFFTTRAIGVILKIVADINPEDVDEIHIILKENEIPAVELRTAKTDVIDLYAEKMTLREFLALSEINTAITETPDIPVERKSHYKYGIRPSFETFLNDPSGFFRYRIGADGWVSFQPWEGSSFILGLATY
ncbi:MAG: YjbH domain-containing protein, partial [Nitrospirota bacterium]